MLVLVAFIYAAIMWVIWPLSFARFTAALLLMFVFSAAMNSAHP